MNKKDIERLIPYKKNGLVLDEITNIDKTSATGKYKITGNETFLDNKYGNGPAVSSTTLCEIMLQLIAVYTAQSNFGGFPILTKIDNARFKKMVSPGDGLSITMNVMKSSSRAIESKCEIFNGNDMVACAELTVAIL